MPMTRRGVLRGVLISALCVPAARVLAAILTVTRPDGPRSKGQGVATHGAGDFSFDHDELHWNPNVERTVCTQWDPDCPPAIALDRDALAKFYRDGTLHPERRA